MPEPKRQCQTCQHFQAAQLAGNGWCTHPARQMESDVKILVRERELACRNAWGDDLWSDPSSPTTTPKSEPSPKLDSYLPLRLDDEVTSVVDASVRQSATPTAEDVVTFTGVRTVPIPSRPANDVNAGAVADQEERARVMARGSRQAILSARKRHALRRSPQQVDPNDLDQMREAHANGLSVPTDQIAGADTEANVIVPPSESNQEPIFHPEAVRSSVGLPRLRNFLRGETGEPVSTADTQDPARPSHFDHVMMQAERIKERTIARQSSMVVQSQELVAPSKQPDVPVVWDVDPGTLDMMFARLRAAVDQPLEGSLAAGNDLGSDVVRLEQNSRTALYVSDPALDLHPDVSSDVGEQHEEYFADPDLDAGSLQEVVHSASGSDELEHIEFESPRSSLWRSFNQRLRRRFMASSDSSSTIGSSYPNVEDEVYSYVDDLDIEEGIQATAFHSNDPDTWYDPAQSTTSLEGPAVVRQETVHVGSDSENLSWVIEEDEVWTATSEESWRLDEREFPEPQPAEWHRTRHELLSSLPPVESLDDSVQFVAPTPQATPVAPLPPRRPLPDPRDFFDITEPGGLAAFRMALFGSSSRPDAERISDFVEVPAYSHSAASMPHDDHAYTPPAGDQFGTRKNEGDWSTTLDPEEPRVDSLTSRGRSTFAAEPYHRTEIVQSEIVQSTVPSARRHAAAPRPVVAAVGTEKCCATCRSFLPDEGGTRGRCTNEWASRHRSVVEANELACRSSFGDWWIPADSTWIPPEGEPSGERPGASRVRTRNLD